MIRQGAGFQDYKTNGFLAGPMWESNCQAAKAHRYTTYGFHNRTNE